MLKLVLNIERFSLFCFFNVVVKCILGPFQDGWAISFKKLADEFILLFDQAKNKKVDEDRT